jgi:hypothetical protein
MAMFLIPNGTWRYKFEAQNPKSETNPNDRMTETLKNHLGCGQAGFGHYPFEH